jgi:hypothetical protein
MEYIVFTSKKRKEGLSVCFTDIFFRGLVEDIK